MPQSDQRHRLVYGKPKATRLKEAKEQKAAGNPTSSVEMNIGGVVIKCRRVLDGLTVLEFANIPQAEEGEELSQEDAQLAALGILNLFKAAVVDYPKFQTAVRDAELEIEELGQMAGDLVEAYTADRPTE